MHRNGSITFTTKNTLNDLKNNLIPLCWPRPIYTFGRPPEFTPANEMLIFTLHSLLAPMKGEASKRLPDRNQKCMMAGLQRFGVREMSDCCEYF